MMLIDGDMLLKEIYRSRKENPHKNADIARNHSLEHFHFTEMVLNSPRLDIDEIKDAVKEDLKNELIEKVKSRSKKACFPKLGKRFFVYASVVGTREIEKIINDVFSKESLKNETD